MEWWEETVVLITGGDDPTAVDKKSVATDFGTGFAVAREGTATLIVTCWHVVHALQTKGQGLFVAARFPCQVVSTPGKDSLDLAVLRVEGLSVAGTLPLAAAAVNKMHFETFGYEPTGRRLCAELSGPNRSGEVRTWDFYLTGPSRGFDKAKGGYSGAPVYDPVSRRVVAVLTHAAPKAADKGFAIDIAHLEGVYPGASAWFVPSDECAMDRAWPAKLLDHQEQLDKVDALLADRQRDPVIAWVECCPEDWPQALADHLQWEHRRRGDGVSMPPATLLSLGHCPHPRAFWWALARNLNVDPGAHIDTQRAQVRGGIIGAGLRVLCVLVALNRLGRHLPEIIGGAHEDLKALGTFASDMRILVLFVAQRTGPRVPWRWRWQWRRRLERLDCCHQLPALRPLVRDDLDDWDARLRPHLKPDQCERLKTDLVDLFGPQCRSVRYQDAWRRLFGYGDLPGVLERILRRGIAEAPAPP
jgi:hypothetical protein